MLKNTSGQYVAFLMLSAEDGTGVTGLTPTIAITKDNGSQTAGAGTVSELGGGQYRYALTQGETNAGTVMILATGTGAVPVSLTAHTWDLTTATAANVTQINGGSTSGNNATLSLKALNIQNDSGSAVVLATTSANAPTIDVTASSGGSNANAIRFTASHGSTFKILTNAAAAGVAGIEISGTSSFDSSFIYGILLDMNTNFTGAMVRGVQINSRGASANFQRTVASDASGDSVINITNSGTDGRGVTVTSAGAAPGVRIVGGTTGIGLSLGGGTSSGSGLAIGGTNAAGILIDTVGGNGITITSSNGHGVYIAASGTGKHDIVADDWGGHDVPEDVDAIKDSLTGPGADVITIRVTEEDETTPFADAEVWLTSTTSASPVICRGRTDEFGEVRFLLTTGATYYLWASKVGMNPIIARSFVAG